MDFPWNDVFKTLIKGNNDVRQYFNQAGGIKSPDYIWTHL